MIKELRNLPIWLIFHSVFGCSEKIYVVFHDTDYFRTIRNVKACSQGF